MAGDLSWNVEPTIVDWAQLATSILLLLAVIYDQCKANQRRKEQSTDE